MVAAEKNILKLKAFEIAVKKLSEADIAAITGTFEKLSHIDFVIYNYSLATSLQLVADQKCELTQISLITNTCVYLYK